MSRRRVRIQPGGMCRTPSSRIVRDGMASESLNLASDLDETVPVLPPELAEGEDIPESWREGNGEMVTVHVQPTYEHHVYQVGEGIGTWAVNDDGEWEFTAFMEMEEGETLNGIVNVGNTLVVSTSEATHYVLWKDGSYRDLGTELPKPAVQFIGGERERRGVFVSGTETKNNITEPQEVYDAIENEVWLAMPSITASEQDTGFSVAEVADHGFFFCGRNMYKEYSDNDEDESDIKDARTRAIWNAYADAVAYASKYNKLDYVNGRAFYQPYLFRYALRLYDGTYVMQSVPVLVGGGMTWPQFLGDVYIGSGHHTNKVRYGFAMIPMFSVRAVMEEEVSDDWGDIVTAVDIFCSSPINPYDPETASISRQGDDVYVTDLADGLDNNIKEGMDWIHPRRGSDNPRYITVGRFWIDESQIEAKLLNYNVFYRIGSFLIDNSGFSLDDDYDPAQEFTANQEDLVAGVQLKKPDADTLVTHTSTASTDWDDYGADSTYHGNAQRVMNQRLAIWDIDETLGRGLNVLNGQSTTAATGNSPIYPDEMSPIYAYRFCYVLDDNGEERWVWGGGRWPNRTDPDGHGDITFIPFASSANGVPEDNLGFLFGNPVICAPFAWLAYPDTRCRRVLFRRAPIERMLTNLYDELVLGDWEDEVWSLPMKEHPFLNCAYAWLGFANALEGAEATEEDKERFRDYHEDRLVRDVNTIMMSVASNPFSFPTGARYPFDYTVVSCAVANKPLSTGQVGDFKLYVLTKGGVWYMEMNKDGTFASSTPGPRDVAVSHKGVCEFDDGFVFITDRGVIAVQGGEFTGISQVMTGRHDPLPDSAVSVLEACGYGKEGVTVVDLSAAWGDGTPFMDFMRGASAGYDYKGDRMIFINDNFNWQWVWMRKTATWHRTMLWEGDYGLTDNGAIKIRSFVNSWPGLLANLVGADEDGDRACAVGEMTSQLDRTRDEGLSSTGLYVSRPLTFDSPDVFKSIMDLRIRGDLRRGNAKRLLLSSNNGHDWVLRTSLRGPSFKFHRIVVVTRMTTNERLSYIEVEVDDRLTNRMR